MDKEQKATFERALKTFGITKQTWMVVEECGELLEAIAKLRRGRITEFDLISELVDVHIMVEQMAIYYGLDSFLREKDRKLRRLVERLDKHES